MKSMSDTSRDEIAIYAASFIDVSLEWWRASGPKTLDRLDSLVEHFTNIRGITDPEIVRACGSEWRPG